MAGEGGIIGAGASGAAAGSTFGPYGAIIGGALGIATGILDSLAANDNARARNRFIEEKFERDKNAAIDNLEVNYRAYRRRTVDERTQLEAQVRAMNIATTEQTGLVAASAGGAGVAGLSVADEIGLSERRLQEATTGVLREQELREADTDQLLRDLRLGTINRIEGSRPAPVVQPNAFGQFLGTLTGGLSGAAAGQGIGSAFSFGASPSASAILARTPSGSFSSSFSPGRGILSFPTSSPIPR